MHIFWSIGLFLSGFLSACTPPEFKALENVTLTCGEDNDCPLGYFCEKRLTPSECRLMGDRDTALPQLGERTLEPALAKVGTVITASFRVNKEVDKANVFLGNDETQNIFVAVENSLDDENPIYQFSYEVTGNEGEGIKTVKVDITDNNGNEATLDVGTVTLDFTGPTVSGNSNLPNYRKEEIVTFTARFSEPLSQAPAIQVSLNETVIQENQALLLQGDAGINNFFHLQENESTNETYVYASDPLSADDNGLYKIRFLHVFDEVGNPQLETSFSSTFEVDASPPQFSSVGLYKINEGPLTASSSFRTSDMIVVCFEFLEESLGGAEPLVQMQGVGFERSNEDFGEACDDQEIFTFTLPLEIAALDGGIGFEEGYTFISLEAQDDVGNRTVHSIDGVVLDFTVPIISDINLGSPISLKREATGAVLFSLSEAVAEGFPKVTLGQAKDMAQDESVVAPNYRYTYTVTDSDVENETPLNVNIHVADAAGNEAFKEKAFNTFDFTAPSVPEFSLNSELFIAGDSLEVTLVFDEMPVGTPVIMGLSGENQIALVGGQTGTVGGFTYVYFYNFLSDDMEGDYEIKLNSVEDLAGNVMDEMILDEVSFDNTVPQVTEISIMPETMSSNDQYVLIQNDVLEVHFNISETLSVATVSLGAYGLVMQTDAAPYDYHFTLQMSELDENQILPLTLNLIDEAGNTLDYEHLELFDVDTQLPELTQLAFSPYQIGVGGLSALYLSANEVLAGFDLLAGNVDYQPEFVWVGESDPGMGVKDRNDFGWQYRIEPSTSEVQVGNYTLESVTIQDVAGNINEIEVSELDAEVVILEPTLTIDNVKPQITIDEDALQDRLSKEPGFNQLEINFCVEEYQLAVGTTDFPNPRVTFGDAGELLDACSSQSQPDAGLIADCEGLSFCFMKPITGNEPEGTNRIEVKATDAVGNFESEFIDVILDFTSPAVQQGTVSIRYEPDEENLLTNVSAATEGTTAVITFSTDESAGDKPDEGEWLKKPQLASTCQTQEAAFQGDLSASRYYVFHLVVDSETLENEGGCELRATLEDDVGNIGAPILLEKVVVVDRTKPVASEVLDLSQVKHLRIPFGASQSGGGSAQYIAPKDLDDFTSPVGLVLPGLIVSGIEHDIEQVWIYERKEGGLNVGRRNVGENGEVTAKDLFVSDSQEIWLAVVDKAGNPSTDRLRPIIEYVITPGDHEESEYTNLNSFYAQKWSEVPLSTYRVTTDITSELVKDDDEKKALFSEVRWQQQRSNIWPQAQYVQSLVYDKARDVLVLYGQAGDYSWESVFNQPVWEMGEVNWVKKDPSGEQPGLKSTQMAYDASRGVVVLFGGTLLDNNYQDGTWEWDGNKWEEKTNLSEQPPEREAHLMAYDSSRGKVFLFGGMKMTASDDSLPCEGSAFRTNNIVDLCFYNDLWEWDGEQWAEISFAGEDAPIARYGHSLFYDEHRDVLVLYGGEIVEDSCSEESGGESYTCLQSSIWEWNGSSWEEKSFEGDQAPTPRSFHKMVYDSHRKVSVLFGGAYYPVEETDAGVGGEGALSFMQDTWEWDGTSWFEKEPINKPVGRSDHSMVYHSARQKVVLYSGNIPLDESVCGDSLAAQVVNACSTSELWEWDGEDWTEKNIFPAARDAHQMVYDPHREVTWLFGGRNEYLKSDENTCEAGEVAELDEDNSCYLAYDDLWQWDGTNWKEITFDEGTGPGARHGHSMTYDATNNLLILYGGEKHVGESGASCDNNTSSNYDGNCIYKDVWQWNGSAWLEMTPSSGEEPLDDILAPTVTQWAYDSERNVAVLNSIYQYSSEDSILVNDHLWEWNGTSWDKRDYVTDLHPLPRKWHSISYDPQRQVTIFFGGVKYFEDFSWELTNEIWEWDGVEWTEKTPETGTVPDANFHLNMVYHNGLNESILYGSGLNYLTSLNLWSWNGVSWTEHVPPVQTVKPLITSALGLTYDVAREQLLVFGGEYLITGEKQQSFWAWEYAVPQAVSFDGAFKTANPQNKYIVERVRVNAVSTLEEAVSSLHLNVAGEWAQLDHVEGGGHFSGEIISPAVLKRLFSGHDKNVTAGVRAQDLFTGADKSVSLDTLEIRIRYNNYDDDEDLPLQEPTCGDGVVHAHLGEVCDDGNTADGDYCSDDCLTELGFCGDGIVQEAAGEVCDGDPEKELCLLECRYVILFDTEETDGGTNSAPIDGGTNSETMDGGVWEQSDSGF